MYTIYLSNEYVGMLYKYTYLCIRFNRDRRNKENLPRYK